MNEDFGGTYVDQYVVTDGNLITGRSAAASIDMAFAIIEYVLGQEECERGAESHYGGDRKAQGRNFHMDFP